MKCDFLCQAPSPRTRFGLFSYQQSLFVLFLHGIFILDSKNNSSVRNAKPPPAATHGWCVRCFWCVPLHFRLLFTLVCFGCSQIEIEFNLYFMYTHNKSQSAANQRTFCCCAAVLFSHHVFFILLNLSFFSSVCYPWLKLVWCVQFHIQTRFNIYFRW